MLKFQNTRQIMRFNVYKILMKSVKRCKVVEEQNRFKNILVRVISDLVKIPGPTNFIVISKIEKREELL
jgi:hypothetical protein